MRTAFAVGLLAAVAHGAEKPNKGMHRMVAKKNVRSVKHDRARVSQHLKRLANLAPSEELKTTILKELDSSTDTDYSEVTAKYGEPSTLDWIVDLYFDDSDDATATSVILDSGSSNLAVAVSSCTNCGKAATDLDMTYASPEECIEVTYGSGEWFGYELASHYVALSSSISTDVTFAGITYQDEFFEGGDTYSGILGMAYDGIANGYSSSTCDSEHGSSKRDFSSGESKPRRLHSGPRTALKASSDETTDTPFMYALDESGAIEKNAFAFAVCDDDAKVSIGGVDESFYTGDISYAETQKTFGEYYGYYLVYMSGLEVDGSDVDLSDADVNKYGGVVVDTGTTLHYLPSSVVKTIETSVKDSVSSVSDSFFSWEACVSSDTISSFPDVVYEFSTSSESDSDTFKITLKPEHYLLSYDSCYYWGFESSTLPIFGNIGMKDKMIVFDITENKMGFADGVCSDESSVKLVAKSAEMIQTKSETNGSEFLLGIASTLAVFGTIMAAVFIVKKHFPKTSDEEETETLLP